MNQLFNIVVMTVPRPTNYIHNIVARLPPNQSLSLVVGCMSTRHVEQFSSDERISVVLPSEAEWRIISKSANGKHHWACWNYWRALKYASMHQTASYSIILEDDVLPSMHWLRVLDKILGALEHKCGNRFLLSLYRPGMRPPNRQPARLGYCEYPPKRFYGSQAMCYPSGVIAEVSRFLAKHGVDSYIEPYDILLGRWVQEAGLRLFSTVPSLVQHIGITSTGLGAFHQSGFLLGEKNIADICLEDHAFR